MSLSKIWVSAVTTFLMKRLSAHRLSGQVDADHEQRAQTSQMSLDAYANTTRNITNTRNDSIFTNKGIASLLWDRTLSKTVDDNAEDDADIQEMIEKYTCAMNDSVVNSLKDMLQESLDGVYSQLDEIKQDNATQFKKIFENSKEEGDQADNRVENSLKEMKEAIKIQHRETRRRLENLEKKTNSGYFN